jgi:hypothetical protein
MLYWPLSQAVFLLIAGRIMKADSDTNLPAKPKSRPAKSSPDVVVDAILSGIRSGRLVPGQRLVEADLTHSLNISRGPVREALKRWRRKALSRSTRIVAPMFAPCPRVKSPTC